MKNSISTVLLISSLFAGEAVASVATFDDLSLSPESFYAPELATTFSSGGADFTHDFTNYGGGCCWSGFTYSNTTDTTTAGFGNQYSAITGAGVNGSTNYGVSNPGFSPSLVNFSQATNVNGAYFTNTTYAYLSMLNGDSFAKQFEEGDFFTLTVSGLDMGGSAVSSLDVSLADGTNLLDSWLWTDLSTLGSVYGLAFSLSSSDVGSFGMNTPAYFAIDDLSFASAVPVPGAVWLFASGLLSLIAISRRRV